MSEEYTYPERIHGEPEDEHGALDYHKVDIILADGASNDKGTLTAIIFQNGPVPEFGRNGATMEDIIGVLVQRLEDYQETKYKCRENALAKTKLEEALHWLGHRTAARVERGVEGTSEV